MSWFHWNTLMKSSGSELFADMQKHKHLSLCSRKTHYTTQKQSCDPGSAAVNNMSEDSRVTTVHDVTVGGVGAVWNTVNVWNVKLFNRLPSSASRTSRPAAAGRRQTYRKLYAKTTTIRTGCRSWYNSSAVTVEIYTALTALCKLRCRRHHWLCLISICSFCFPYANYYNSTGLGWWNSSLTEVFMNPQLSSLLLCDPSSAFWRYACSLSLWEMFRWTRSSRVFSTEPELRGCG